MGQHLAAMKFLYRKTLGQPEKVAWVSFPRVPRRLPKILTPEQLKALLDALQLDVLRVIVMVLYASGLRISEACALKVTDLDSTAGRPLFRAWRSRPQQTRRDASSGRIVDPRHRSAARESELNGVGIG
jgi:integrase